jgi:outer membrane biogenesis lipoprotein LolB
MKMLQIGLLVVVLLAVAMLSGCQHPHSMRGDQVSWEPIQTDFWHPQAD